MLINWTKMMLEITLKTSDVTFVNKCDNFQR